MNSKENTIRKYRERAGLSQSDASEILGIPLGTLQNWEQGRRSAPKWAEKMIVEKLAALPQNRGESQLIKLPETRSSRMLEEDHYRFGSLEIVQLQYGSKALKVTTPSVPDAEVTIITRNESHEKIKPYMLFGSQHLFVEDLGEISQLQEFLDESKNFFKNISRFPELL